MESLRHAQMSGGWGSRPRVSALCFTMVLVTARMAPARLWVNTGPEGGPVRALAVDPTTASTLYAGTDGAGVFKSTNGGASWNASNTANIIMVRALAVDPTDEAQAQR